MKRTHTATVVLIASLFMVSCGGGRKSVLDQQITVVASFYPIEEILTMVGGVHVKVIGLTPPGQGAHDLELSAKTINAVSRASAVFYLGDGFQPYVEKALTSMDASVTKVDLLRAVDVLDIAESLNGGKVDGEVLASGRDPHVWLDPQNMVKMTNAVVDALSLASPKYANEFAKLGKQYIASLKTLGEQIDQQLATCKSRSIVTSHRAFAYLAKRANLIQVSISGVNPEEEPSVKTLEQIAKYAKANNVTTIFFETLLPEDLARTLAEKVGATTDLLDPIEGISSEDLANGASYISVQQDNLTRLAKGLRCS